MCTTLWEFDRWSPDVRIKIYIYYELHIYYESTMNTILCRLWVHIPAWPVPVLVSLSKTLITMNCLSAPRNNWVAMRVEVGLVND